jgi:hypothetical protein
MASISLICYNNSNIFRSSFTPRHKRSWENLGHSYDDQSIAVTLSHRSEFANAVEHGYHCYPLVNSHKTMENHHF